MKNVATKILAVALAGGLALSLSACGASGSTDGGMSSGMEQSSR